MKSQFEQHLKQSLENYEVKYNSAHWADMEKRLDKMSAGKPASNAGKIIGIAAAGIAAVGLIYFLSTNHSEKTKVEQPAASSQVVSSAKTETQENQVRQNENSQTVNHNSEIASKENVTKEKTITIEKNNSSETKPAAEKTESTNNVTENKTENQKAQTQNPPQQVQINSFNAAFNSPSSACSGTAVEFSALTKEQSVYHWDFGDGKTSGETNPKHIFQKAGTYTVKLKLTSVKNKTTDEQKNTLTVNPVPITEINSSVADDNNPSLIIFEAKDKTIKDWSWNFGDGQNSKEQNPAHSYIKTGTYDVIATTTNNFGCSVSVRKTINIENLFPLAPNSFTPNGDGKNDEWMPISFVSGDYNFTLRIFDRNGQKVFETSDKNNAWDGANTKAGDVFIWKATVKEKNGKEANYSGTITVAP